MVLEISFSSFRSDTLIAIRVFRSEKILAPLNDAEHRMLRNERRRMRKVEPEREQRRGIA